MLKELLAKVRAIFGKRQPELDDTKQPVQEEQRSADEPENAKPLQEPEAQKTPEQKENTRLPESQPTAAKLKPTKQARATETKPEVKEHETLTEEEGGPQATSETESKTESTRQEKQEAKAGKTAAETETKEGGGSEAGKGRETLDSKREKLENEAAKKASQFKGGFAQAARELKTAISAVATKEIDPKIQFYKIAHEHQKSFAMRLRPLQQEIAGLDFPEDYHRVLESQKNLTESLTAMNRVVVDNRYVYAFFGEELREFNAAMKRLLEINAGMAKALSPAYDFGCKCNDLHAAENAIRETGNRLDTVNEQLEETARQLERLESEETALRKQWSEAEWASSGGALERAKADEKAAEWKFESFLGSIEGLLKSYARGKNPGAHASSAEKYLRDAEAFIGDCTAGEEKTEMLISAIEPLKPELFAEFKLHRFEWVGELAAARNATREARQRLEEMESMKRRVDGAASASNRARDEKRLLGEKASEIAAEKAAKEAELKKGKERLLDE